MVPQKQRFLWRLAYKENLHTVEFEGITRMLNTLAFAEYSERIGMSVTVDLG